MSSWGTENFMMQNMMGMPPMQPIQNFPNHIQGMMPSPMPNMIGGSGMPINSLPDFNVNEPPPNLETSTAPLIGPVIPDNFKPTEAVDTKHENASENEVKQNRSSRDNRSDRRENRDRRHRSRSYDRSRHDRDRGDRSDRDRSSRNDRNDKGRGNRRDRHSKWDSGLDGDSASTPMPIANMIVPGTAMQYGQMNNMMGQQQMDMSPNMASNMQNMQPSNMAPMSHNMMSMMPNMMDQSMMMMNQQMPMMGMQQIYVTNAVLLPPAPGVAMMARREKPNGCKTIFIGGLPNGISDDAVKEIFQRFGDIDHVKIHNQGVCHVRFENPGSVEQAFFLSGYRFKYHDQTENEATTMFVDYALNRDDQNEYERNKRRRATTPPRVEPYSPAALNIITEKVKSDTEFAEAAPTLAFWLERGECNKKNASTFYSLIQASNNQIRRLFNEKMMIDEEFQTVKNTFRDKFAHVLMQFEQVAKILSASKHQRVSDHFSKQQRRNIEMWLKMTEEVENMKEEFNALFDEEEGDKTGRNMVSQEKYEELKIENEQLTYELEGYRNEAHLAKDEAERKFEKFKAHFIAQQALQNNKQTYPPLPPPPMPTLYPEVHLKPPLPEDKHTIQPPVPPSDAKLISILTGFLMVHPLGATLDYLVSYVKSMVPHASQMVVQQILQKYDDVFRRTTSGVGATIEHRWGFVTYDVIKRQDVK